MRQPEVDKSWNGIGKEPSACGARLTWCRVSWSPAKHTSVWVSAWWKASRLAVSSPAQKSSAFVTRTSGPKVECWHISSPWTASYSGRTTPWTSCQAFFCRYPILTTRVWQNFHPFYNWFKSGKLPAKRALSVTPPSMPFSSICCSSADSWFQVWAAISLQKK